MKFSSQLSVKLSYFSNLSRYSSTYFQHTKSTIQPIAVKLSIKFKTNNRIETTNFIRNFSVEFMMTRKLGQDKLIEAQFGAYKNQIGLGETSSEKIATQTTKRVCT
ncbi:hypothetical protein QQ045_000359 [Rhodiola kirilowii]